MSDAGGAVRWPPREGNSPQFAIPAGAMPGTAALAGTSPGEVALKVPS